MVYLIYRSIQCIKHPAYTRDYNVRARSVTNPITRGPRDSLKAAIVWVECREQFSLQYNEQSLKASRASIDKLHICTCEPCFHKARLGLFAFANIPYSSNVSVHHLRFLFWNMRPKFDQIVVETSRVRHSRNFNAEANDAFLDYHIRLIYESLWIFIEEHFYLSYAY